MPKVEGDGGHNQTDSLAFKFDGVLEGASQDTVYSTCAQEVVDSVLSGYNGTVFCYGQVQLAHFAVPPCQPLCIHCPSTALLKSYRNPAKSA